MRRSSRLIKKRRIEEDAQRRITRSPSPEPAQYVTFPEGSKVEFLSLPIDVRHIIYDYCCDWSASPIPQDAGIHGSTDLHLITTKTAI
ncbi:hypothetical protein KVT40_007360 [Elsinoe batatas]|uniref:Uncharacterized protein n=1 Tax=Elsinoe batatas TaxID=2601811 RepID=A0A8K0L1V2_9PEZI|nr:hypothetical protein KVT40_007360 [Elsinoe batatas]